MASSTFSIVWPKSKSLERENKQWQPFIVLENKWATHGWCVKKIGDFTVGDYAYRQNLEAVYKNLTPEFFDLYPQMEVKMERYWPNVGADDQLSRRRFWIYQAKEHGRFTCLTPENYFLTILRIAKKVQRDLLFPIKNENQNMEFGRANLFSADDLRAIGIKVNFRAEHLNEDLLQAYPNLQVPGQDHTLILVEAKFFLDKNLEFVLGEGKVSNTVPACCPNPRYLLPRD